MRSKILDKNAMHINLLASHLERQIKNNEWAEVASVYTCTRELFGGHHSGNKHHYNDVTMGTIASQITSLTIVYSAVYSDADQRKYQSSVSLAFVRRIHRRPVNSPHKWPVTRKMFPFDDVIMQNDIGMRNRQLFVTSRLLFYLHTT